MTSPRRMQPGMCTVVSRRPINDSTVILTLADSRIAETAQPGQFVNILAGRTLRRPIGVMATDPAEGTFRVGVRIVGGGSADIAAAQPGAKLDLIGPLGHGFRLSGYDRVITVGGGSGVFPLFFVQQRCRDTGVDAIAVCGYRSRRESMLGDELRSLGCRTLLAADEGDLDFPGNAAEALHALLQDVKPVGRTAVLTCGPNPMMRAVSAVASAWSLPCQVSLEGHMACGIGVCLSCACRIRAGDQEHYQRCCVEGPVFDAETVVWDAADRA